METVLIVIGCLIAYFLVAWRIGWLIGEMGK